jgi:hypothetical protein
MLRAVVMPSQYGHSGLPGEPYVVVCLVVLAYFACHGVVAIVATGKARYGERVAHAGALGTASGMTTVGAATIVAVRTLDFFGERLWWWAPTIAVLMPSIGAAILRNHAAISVTPFMYTVF